MSSNSQAVPFFSSALQCIEWRLSMSQVACAWLPAPEVARVPARQTASGLRAKRHEPGDQFGVDQ